MIPKNITLIRKICGTQAKKKLRVLSIIVTNWL